MLLYSELKDRNNQTIKEENNNMKHNIPIDTLVEIDLDKTDLKYISEKIAGLRLFVIGHTRDCDGTPLYQLYPRPLSEYNKCLNDMKLIFELNNLTHLNMDKMADNMRSFGVIGGLSEYSLKIIYTKEEHPQN